jgi:hypothetical protein
MRPLATALAFLITSAPLLAAEPQFDATAAERFAKLALACVHKEYPNKIGHTMASDADSKPPRELTPAFYGCYDWHSSVHGHWLLARIARQFPEALFAADARTALRHSITPEAIAVEVDYLNAPGRASFERPYGLAWLLKLGQELRAWDDDEARMLSKTLRPLELASAARLKGWIPKLTHPVRSGEHSQTAFAFGLIIDAARRLGDPELATLVRNESYRLFQSDRNCPLTYEPSGEDFLSPCLAEADLMRRLAPKAEYASWLMAFLPQIPVNGSAKWLVPEVVSDPSDPKLAHLDGLNLSRAWMLDGIASGLPASDKRLPAIRAAAQAHRVAGLAAVTGEHYEGGHWLGSFAIYLATHSGTTP